jgi:hypothetical protein
MADITSVGGYRKGYTLEVQRYDGIMWKHDPSVGKFFHIGYMKALFPNRRIACKYYDKWNTHLRPINFHGTYCSAVDPENKLRYVVRKYHGETQTQNPFCLTDLPTYKLSKKGDKIISTITDYPKYEYLFREKKSRGRQKDLKKDNKSKA